MRGEEVTGYTPVPVYKFPGPCIVTKKTFHIFSSSPHSASWRLCLPHRTDPALRNILKVLSSEMDPAEAYSKGFGNVL